MGEISFGHDGQWVTIEQDGKVSVRKALECDLCQLLKPHDEILIFNLAEGDWAQICKACNDKR